MKPTHADKTNQRLFLTVFFLSGFSSMIYQTVWQKVLSQVVGVDHYSVVLIVSLFMLGLGLGGSLGGRLAESKVNLTKLYANLEWALALFGIFSIYLIRQVNALFVHTNPGHSADFFINFIILLFPTILMGASLPIVLQIFRNVYPAGRAVGVVYTVNILGAAAGILFTGFILIGTIGMTASSGVAALLNLLLGLVVWLRFPFSEIKGDSKKVSADLDKKSLKLAHLLESRWILVSLVIGFAALGYEMIFFRMFTSYFGATSYVFPLLIFSYLVAMGFGNHYFGKKSENTSLPKLFLVIVSMAISTTLFILWGEEFFHRIGVRQNYLVFWPFQTWLSYAQILPMMGLALVLMTPVFFISGLFPVMVRALTLESRHLGAQTGKLYFVQTIGNFLGALMTGLYLLPSLGTVGSLKFMAGLLIAAFLLSNSSEVQNLLKERKTAGLALLGIFAITLYPQNFYKTVRYYHESDKTDVQAPMEIREDAFGATLAYISNQKMQVYVGRQFSNSFRMKPDLVQENDKCFPFDWISSIKDLKVKRVLYIGLGSANGLFCIHKFFPDAEIDVVEINPQLPVLIKQYGADSIVQVLEKSNVYITDGRRFVQQNPDKKYDLIHVGVFNSWCSGCGNLFTQDFMKMLADHLSPKGIVTYNAYPPAVKGGLDVFSNLVLLSPGTSRISEVCASNDSSQNFEMDRSLFLENMHRLESETGSGTVQINRQFLEEGSVIPREKVKEMLHAIAKSTDDLPATEYFLTQNQFIHPINWFAAKPEKDMRVFECNDCEMPFKQMLTNPRRSARITS